MTKRKSWRELLVERIDGLCDPHPGNPPPPINREPVTWWKNANGEPETKTIMPKFRKKPVEIEAVEWSGANISEITAFLHGAGKLCFGDVIEIKTLEGMMRASIGDWIIKGVKGEFYPCKPDIFAATYEPVLPPNLIELR